MATLTAVVDAPVEVRRSPFAGRLATTVAALAAIGLAVASVTGASDATAAVWVRALLVVAWALAAVTLASRGLVALGATVAVIAALGGLCAATDEAIDAETVHVFASALIPAAALHLELVLPHAARVRRARVRVAVVVYVLAAIGAAALLAGGRRPGAEVVAALVITMLLLGLPAAHLTYSRSTGASRQRLQLVGCAAAVIVEIAVIVGALHVLVGWPDNALALAAASTALVPAALAAGTSARVVRRVDRVLAHTVSITGLTAVVAAVYLVIVIGLGRGPAKSERTLLGLSMVAAAVAAMVYVPARDRLAETANRLVYGERHPPDEVLRTWGSRLSRAIPMDELLLQLAESLRKVMVLRRAEVWTGNGEHLELAVAVPDREAAPLVIGPKERPVIARAGVSGNAWLSVWLPALLEGRPRSQVRAAPACHSGELLGLIVVERDADADQFAEEDDRVLTELARQVGLALHNVELDSALQASLEELQVTNDELRASRARIVATADLERRKIERNLHDGAQQHLVALAVNLRLARDMLGDDPETAAEMLDQLATEVKDTIQELRDLAHGIYPPLLMDSGLPDALRAAATRSPLEVSVETDGVGRYSTELEAAVYFCCLEALQNAAKHAPEATVRIEVQEADGTVRFTVSDNGPGFDPALATRGHGFVNMSDRVGAVGGRVEWRRGDAGGATVEGRIPVA